MADGLDKPDLSYRYRIIDMHGIDCDGLLSQDSPDAWVLAILCDFKSRQPREVIHDILGKLLEKYMENPPRLREYVDMLDILGTNRGLNVDIREELKMLTIDVEKLATYQIGMEKGMEKGMERGMERGIEKGMERGMEKGMVEGREKGAREQSVAIAKNLLEIGLMGAAQVAQVTGLPLAEVEALAEKQLGRSAD